MKVHLVDGTVELFRCFHGAPRARNAAGDEVGAARGVLATLSALLREHDTTHVAVTFDSLLAPAKPDELSRQVPLAVAIVRALGIVVWPSGRFSADELLASGARRFRDDVDQVVLCTTDLDNAQCIRGDRVILRNRSTRVDLDEQGVRDRFAVDPQQLPDLFALVGDRSDGIAGLPGFGLKSASVLVRHFGTLENIPTDVAQWPTIRGATQLCATYASHRAETLHARDLLVLRDDAPIPYTADDLQWRGVHREAIASLIAQLDAPELADQLPG